MDFNWINFSNPVALWWMFLSIASIVNILAWTWTRLHLYKDISIKSFNLFKFNPENLIWFSGIYVFGCAYRSFLPRADVQRICLFDTWISSIFLGRSVATIAEIAFVIQWAIVLRFLAKQTNDNVVKIFSSFIVPIIIAAECFSWFAVITTNYLGNTIEESLWTITYTFIMIALVRLWPKFKGAFRYAISISIFGSFIYILFMIFVDIRMYFTRWQRELMEGKTHFTFKEGLIDLNSRWIVTHDVNQWRAEIPWMSLYFSFAVFVSLLLCYVPLDKKALTKHLAIK